MEQKSLIWVTTVIGSSIGGYAPLLWGANVFSFSSIILGTLGGILGIWLGFKIAQEL
jgi:hypothetical protein